MDIYSQLYVDSLLSQKYPDAGDQARIADCLAARTAFRRRGHRKHPGAGVPQGRVELVGEVVAGTASAGAEAIPTLDHESVDHPVKDDAVVIRPAARLPGDRAAPDRRAVLPGGALAVRRGSGWPRFPRGSQQRLRLRDYKM